MDTAWAIAQIANERCAGGDGSRTAGAAEIRRQCSALQEHVLATIDLAYSIGARPHDDPMTQTRLAAAVGRQIIGGIPESNPAQTARTLEMDYLLQEAAGAQVPGGHDQIGTRAGELLLARHGMNASHVLARASGDDVAAISMGRYDRISQDHTRFLISSQTRLSARAMTAEIKTDPQDMRDAPYPRTGSGKGPAKAESKMPLTKAAANER